MVDRKYMVRDWERPRKDGRYNCSCETHFKPYDLAVTAALIRITERLGDVIGVGSENTEHGFTDAKRLCRELFGFGERFDIQQEEAEILR